MIYGGFFMLFVFNRKRVLFVIFAIVISIIGAKAPFVRENPQNVTTAIPTVALPSSNKVVVIDAGHGSPDERCIKF